MERANRHRGPPSPGSRVADAVRPELKHLTTPRSVAWGMSDATKVVLGTVVVAGLLAYVFSRVGGRFTTVVVAYPFGVTALLLPPVVAALYSPTLAETVFSRSTAVARWINDNLLDVYNINQRLRRSYDLRGVAHAAVWFIISIPVGWLLGTIVTLANYVRPGR